MRYLDMQTWPRRRHFQLFGGFNHPHFSLCVNMDVTAFYPFVKRHGHSLTVAMVYVITRAANAVPEFRQRIRGEQVVEHERVNPSFSLLVDEELFGFCAVEYAEAYAEFARRAALSMAQVKAQPDLTDDPEADDVLYMSPIPWVSFTSFNHPMQFHPADSVPRFAWGKSFSDQATLKMPLSVQGHHAVMDGLHMARYYAKVQDYLDHPEVTLGDAE